VAELRDEHPIAGPFLPRVVGERARREHGAFLFQLALLGEVGLKVQVLLFGQVDKLSPGHCGFTHDALLPRWVT
jgi:hypothetical protein